MQGLLASRTNRGQGSFERDGSRATLTAAALAGGMPRAHDQPVDAIDVRFAIGRVAADRAAL